MHEFVEHDCAHDHRERNHQRLDNEFCLAYKSNKEIDSPVNGVGHRVDPPKVNASLGVVTARRTGVVYRCGRPLT